MTPELFADALTTAPMLLGATLTHHTVDGPISGIIVETEAYTQDDPAAHTYRGKTQRNQAMFERGGTIYIYFTYGMHYCMNFVCGPEHSGQGVLIRALQPVEGIDLMLRNRSKRRPITNIAQLTNGPAKLVQALAIPPSYNGRRLANSPLQLSLSAVRPKYVARPRVGITQGADLLRRFYIAANPYVSKPW